MKTATVYRNTHGLHYATITVTDNAGKLTSRYSTKSYATPGRARAAAEREGVCMVIEPTAKRAVVDPVADYHRAGVQ